MKQPCPGVRRLRRTRAVGTAFAVAALAAFAAGQFGLYDVSATAPHASLTYDLVHWVAVRSIENRARGLKPPDLAPSEIARGVLVHDRVCAACHGAPGRAPEPFAEGLNPGAPPLQMVGREWSLEAVFQATRSGIKMTGMPAFEFRLPERDIWAVALFVAQASRLSVADYRARVASAEAAQPDEPAPESPSSTPDADRGRIALMQHGCATCHAIPGLPGGNEAQLGPPLAGVGGRAFVAGALADTDANLARFIRHPQRVRPEGAMPDMRVSPRDAADMVAYLRRLTSP